MKTILLIVLAVIAWLIGLAIYSYIYDKKRKNRM